MNESTFQSQPESHQTMKAMKHLSLSFSARETKEDLLIGKLNCLYQLGDWESFDETANLTNYDKMLHAGFFLYLFGFVCTLGGMIGSTLAKIFAEKVDSTPSYSEPNPNFDNVESI